MPQDMALSFDIALHFGTLLAILLYFFKDFWNMAVKGFTKGVKDKDGKILWYLVVATIPAAVAGLLFEDKIDEVIICDDKFYTLCLIILYNPRSEDFIAVFNIYAFPFSARVLVLIKRFFHVSNYC